MEDILLAAKEQILLTIQLAKAFFKEVNPTNVLIGFGLLYAFVMRRWGLKKMLSFLLTIGALFIIMLRLEHHILGAVGSENAYFSMGMGRMLFSIVVAIVFIYNALIKE